MLIGNCLAQTNFIRESIKLAIRIDGRDNETRRTPIIKTDVLPHLSGSSYLYLEYQNIEIYTGVKIKLQKVQKIPLVPSIILEINCMKKLSEQETDEQNRLQTLLQSQLIDKLAKQPLLADALRIEDSRMHELVLYIDVFLLSEPRIEQLQLIGKGIKSAIDSMQISDLSVTYNEVTEEEDIELLESFKKCEHQKWQELVIVGVVDDERFVVDLRKEEYEAMTACFLVIISEGKVVYIETLKGSITVEGINRMARFAVMVTEKDEN